MSAASTLTPAASFSLERVSPADRYFDYCLQPYRPRRPSAGKLRSSNLLLRFLEHAGLLERALPVLEALRADLGRDMTVWGAKIEHLPGGPRLFFELYLYDPQQEEPKARAAGLKATLAPHLALLPEVPAHARIMMISFDLDAEILAKGEVPELNLYLTGTELHEGRSYIAGSGGVELANFYRFLRPKAEVDTVLGLLRSSVFVDYGPPRALAEALPPELFACKRVCVAKKRRADGVYFSGIDVDQLLWFFRRHAYPAGLIAFTEAAAGQLDHLYFDVGIDLAQGPDGALFFPKTSFYGTY